MRHTISTMMNLNFKTLLLSTFLILGFNKINAQQQQVYWISQSELVNVGTTCRTSTNSGTAASAFGFNWTDVLGTNATINSVTIEFIIGTECTGATRSTTLNGNTQGSITTTTQCTCTPTTLTTQTPTINISNYIRGGANQFRITSSSSNTGFSSNSSLANGGINYFAKVTVNYSTFSGPVPTITSFSPSSGSCNTVVTIDGTNFDNGTPIVKFNGVTAAHTYISATQLTATVPAGATTGAITVQTSGGIATSSTNFTVNTSSPTISSVSSSTGTRGTILTITGTNLTCPTAVTFGGTAAYSFNATSNTSITAEVGYGSSGNIAVTTAGGTATLAGFTYTAPAAANAINIQGSTSTNTITNNQASIVDNGLTVSSNGLISGFVVTITDSYQSGDVLAYNTSTGGVLPAGISVASFNNTTRSLVFTGSAIGSDWQRILRNVTLTTTSAVCSPESRKIAFIAGDVFYNPLNGHFYKSTTTTSNWTSAKADAENMSYFGKKGYLATITSQAENSFISKLLGQDSWIGCSDNFQLINSVVGYTKYANQNAAEGYWHWVTGPEQGTQMRTGNAQDYRTGADISGVYQNWAFNEPNDWPVNTFAGDEDYGHIYVSAGDWNDFPNTSSIRSVIEFGDMPGDNTSGNINTVFTRNIYINGAPSGSITGGNVNVCSGSNSTVLTLTGMASGGTVARWEYSLDNFLTAGINVTSTSTSLTVTNISETRYYRAIVNASSCTGLATSSTKIGVATTTAGSIVSNKSAICTGGSTELTLSGNIGSVVRWERSTSSTFASGVTSISNTTTSLTETLSTAGTYYYRAVVQQSGCGSAINSNGYPVTVTAGSPPVGGTISSSSSCSGTNNITLTLSGHSGNITKWQFSTDGGFVWTDIVNTSTTLNQTNVTSNRRYRAIVSTTNQACGNESSSSGEVTVFGTTIVRWDGTNSKNSKTLGNWCGGIPTNGQDIIISATATNDLMLEDNKILGSIDFNGSSRLVEIGNFDLQVNELKGIGANNYIKTNGTGQLKINLAPNTPTTFHVGNSTKNPVTITNKNNSSDNFGVRVLDEVYADGLNGSIISSPRVKRTWDISKTNANSGGVDFTFTWNSSQEQGVFSTYKLNHYKNTAWEIAAGTSGTPSGITTKTMTHTAYTGTFSPFAIGGEVTPLPVTLKNFDAKIANSNALLTWTTANETNNSHFEVLKSTDGETWDQIGEVKGAGTSYYAQNSYNFTDTRFQGLAYYKLRQVDYDGNFSYSPIRMLHSSIGSVTSPSVVYPNPSQGSLSLLAPENSRYELYDVLGKQIREGKVSGGMENIENLSTGVYTLKVIATNNIEYIKVVVE